MDATSCRLVTLPSDRLHEAVDPHVWRETSTARITSARLARLALNQLALLLSGAGPEEAAKFNGKDPLCCDLCLFGSSHSLSCRTRRSGGTDGGGVPTH